MATIEIAQINEENAAREGEKVSNADLVVAFIAFALVSFPFSFVSGDVNPIAVAALSLALAISVYPVMVIAEAALQKIGVGQKAKRVLVVSMPWMVYLSVWLSLVVGKNFLG